MNDVTIRILNSVTKALIDSSQGYQACAEVCEDNYKLQSEFARRRKERNEIISEFQNHVRELGGAPAETGSLSGAVHRGFTRFSSLFRDDEVAAISALDDGEEFLAEKIEDKLKDYIVDNSTAELLTKAHLAAKKGERFADMIGQNFK